MDIKLSSEQVIFGLDIGTRSVVGLVGYKSLGNFTVIGEYTQLHETRAMIDGQIHDVNRVAATIKKVKDQLEKQIGFELHDVSIAAAGRVLKTCQVRVDEVVDPNQLISQDRIYALELLGMEKAHQVIRDKTQGQVTSYHCVGYTVSKYYLNDYEISHLEGHKGNKISADILATFLPKEVVESLYQVVDQAGLSVRNLTLEPIAAIDVAIPPNYRLLNIALVDIGAGTSDIAITKEGSIVAYGMIPVAGDEVTEKLVHKYLIDFATAETVKIKSAGKSKTVSFKDIMGMKHKVEMDDVRMTLKPAMERLAREIADKIVSLNGDQATNAVFVVGGGGQLKGFDDLLADYLKIPSERVAIRGKEVLDMVALETETKLGPEMVTPIGICYSAMARGKHDFIQVFFNDEPIKVFNSNRITVMDIAAFKGYDPRKLLVSRGEDLIIRLDGEEKIVRGEPGIGPSILINNEVASMNDTVQMNDYITIVDAKKGKKGALSTNQLLQSIEAFSISINNVPYSVEPKLMVNGEVVQRNRDLVTGDQVTVVGPTISEVFVKHRIAYNQSDIYVNGPVKTLTDRVNDHDIILFDAYKETSKEVGQNHTSEKEIQAVEADAQVLDSSKRLVVMVNNQPTVLEGKDHYVFADVFDFIDFDRTKAKGNLICQVNGSKIGYLDTVNDSDIIEIYWEKYEA